MLPQTASRQASSAAAAHLLLGFLILALAAHFAARQRKKAHTSQLPGTVSDLHTWNGFVSLPYISSHVVIVVGVAQLFCA